MNNFCYPQPIYSFPYDVGTVSLTSPYVAMDPNLNPATSEEIRSARDTLRLTGNAITDPPYTGFPSDMGCHRPVMDLQRTGPPITTSDESELGAAYHRPIMSTECQDTRFTRHFVSGAIAPNTSALSSALSSKSPCSLPTPSNPRMPRSSRSAHRPTPTSANPWSNYDGAHNTGIFSPPNCSVTLNELLLEPSDRLSSSFPDYSKNSTVSRYPSPKHPKKF